MSEFDPRQTPKPFNRELAFLNGQAFLLGNEAIVAYLILNEPGFGLRPFLSTTVPEAIPVLQERNINRFSRREKADPNKYGTLIFRVSLSEGRRTVYIGADYSLTFLSGGTFQGIFALDTTQPCEPQEVSNDLNYKDYLRSIREG